MDNVLGLGGNKLEGQVTTPIKFGENSEMSWPGGKMVETSKNPGRRRMAQLCRVERFFMGHRMILGGERKGIRCGWSGRKTAGPVWNQDVTDTERPSWRAWT